MASWLVSRLVSGLGVATKAAALPLASQATWGTASVPLIRLVASSWGVWPQPGQAARRASPAPAAFSSSSSPLEAPATIATVAAAADLPSAGPLSPAAVLLQLPRTGSLANLATSCARHSATANSFTTTATTTANASVAARAAAASTAACFSSAAAAAAFRKEGGAPAAGDFSAAGDGAGDSGGGGAVGEGGAPLPDAAKPDLVEKFLSLDVCSSSVRRRAERQGVMAEFQRHPADCGSPQVMVALWTHRVRSLVRFFDSNRKQLPAIRDLEMLVNRRRRMLTWLRKADFESYSYTIAKLGLQDIYVPAGGEHRYREGVRPADPVDDQINRRRFALHTKYRQGKTSLWHRLRPKLVAEDPTLQVADADIATKDQQQRQKRREVAAQQRMATEQEHEMLQQQQQQRRK